MPAEMGNQVDAGLFRRAGVQKKGRSLRKRRLGLREEPEMARRGCGDPMPAFGEDRIDGRSRAVERSGGSRPQIERVTEILR